MATVRRYSADAKVPVQQANLISAGDFRPDTSSADTLRIAGKAVGDLGIDLKREREVKEELAKRKRDSQDRIGITNVNAIMDDAEREYAKQIIGKPLTDHAAIRQKVIDSARANQQDLTPEARDIADSNWDIEAEKFADEAELANIVATNKDALIRTSEAYETALVERDIDTIAEAEALLDAELKNMEPAEARMMKEKVLIRGQYNFGIKFLESDPEKFLEAIDDKEFLPQLDAQAKSQLKRWARTEIGLRLSIHREAKEQEINDEQGRLLNVAREGELTNDLIRDSKLDEFGLGSKDTFYKMLDAQADAEIEKRENPYLKSDPQVEAGVFRMLRDPKYDMTAKDITGLIGKGLSIDDASRIINDLDVYKGFWFRRADSYLKSQLGWSDALTRFAHPEGGLSYGLAMNALFDALETDKLKDRDILDRAMQISIPHLIDYWENVLMYKGSQLERLKEMLNAKTQPGRPTKEETPKSGIDPKGIFE